MNRFAKQLMRLQVGLWALLLASCSTQLVPPETDIDRIRGDVAQFGQWSVGCDNLRTCTALVPLRRLNPEDGLAHLRMTYLDSSPEAFAIEIASESDPFERLTPTAAKDLTQDLLHGQGDEAFLVTAQLRRYALPRGGFAQLHALLERWRNRFPQEGPTTIVVVPMPATRLDSFRAHPDLVDAAERCPDGHMGESLQAWRNIGGSILWRVGCGNEGLNPISFWYISGPQGEPPVELQLRNHRGQLVTPYNSWFEERTGYLRTVHYFGGHFTAGHEDCGVFSTFAWSIDGMKLIQQRALPLCLSRIAPEDWIDVFNATILQGTDQGV